MKRNQQSSVIFNCKGFIDRRGPRELEAARAVAQESADKAIEKRWRQRVADNPKEIQRLNGIRRHAT